jgi:hypothetical protein
MLPSSMAYIRHVVLITFILTIILTSIYFNKSTKVIDQDDLLKQVEPKKKSSVCDLVDMQWL